MRDLAVLDPALGQKKQGSTWLASNNKNVATDYIEYEDGTMVMGDTVKSVCSHARAVLIEMDNHDIMQLPSSWLQLGSPSTSILFKRCTIGFPISASETMIGRFSIWPHVL